MVVYITGRKSQVANYLLYYLRQKGINVYLSSVSIKNYHGLLSEMLQLKPDVVIHVAQYTNDDPLALKNINIIGTKNVINAMQQVKCNKIIYMSTSELYNYKSNITAHENTLLYPNNNYKISKLVAEQIIFSASNIKSIIVRTCKVVGYDAAYNNSFFDKIHRITENQIVLHLKPNKYEFLALEDMANAYYLLLSHIQKSKNNKQEIYNLTNDCTYNKIIIVIAWQKYLASKNKTRMLVIVKKLPEIPLFTIACNDKLKNTTGWAVRKTIEDIISGYPLS